MKLTFDPANLRNALEIIGKGVPSRTNLPILSSIKIDVDVMEQVWFSSNNSVFHMTNKVYGAVGEAKGIESICFPFKKLEDFASKMDAPIEMTVNPKTLKSDLSCGTFRAKNIDCFDAADFPVVDEIKWDTILEMDATEFSNRLERVVVGASHKESAIGYQSVTFSVTDKKLTLVGRDGFRATVSNGISVDGKNGFYIVPEDAIKKAVAISSQFDSLYIRLSKAKVEFDWGDAKMVSATLAFNFSFPFQFLTDELQQRAVINAKSLGRALAVNRMFYDDRPDGMKDLVKVLIGKDTVRLYSDDMAFGDGVVDASVDGDEVEFATSCSQIQEFLGVAKTDKVVVGMGKTSGAIFLRPENDDTFVNMLAPVHFNQQETVEAAE